MTTATLNRKTGRRGGDGTTTAQLLAELASMRDQAGPKVYRRVKLAELIFSDKDWVNSVGGPDEAEKILADDHLGDLCGVKAVEFRELLEIIDLFPEDDQWRAYKWNLRRLYAEVVRVRKASTKSDGEAPARRTVKIKEHEQALQKIKELEFDRKRDRQTIESKVAEAGEKDRRISDLEKEVARLSGRIEELERQLRLNAA